MASGKALEKETVTMLLSSLFTLCPSSSFLPGNWIQGLELEGCYLVTIRQEPQAKMVQPEHKAPCSPGVCVAAPVLNCLSVHSCHMREDF